MLSTFAEVIGRFVHIDRSLPVAFRCVHEKTLIKSANYSLRKIYRILEWADMPLDIGPDILSVQLIPNPVKLLKPINLRFRTFDSNYTNPYCSFWKFNASGDGDGAWSNDGCEVVSRTSNGIVCECDHLTNFAILITTSEVTDLEHNATLGIISVVGCAVSLACLMLTLLGHLSIWRHMKSQRTYILTNICLALLPSYTTFIAGVNRTENKVVCTAIAALLHYFFLTVFFLMLVQGIWIAVSIMSVFGNRFPMHWLLLLGWLIPMVIVGASLGISRLDGYGNQNFCWLSTRDGLIWAFAGPAALVIVINGIIICVTTNKMLRTSAFLKKTKQAKARASLRALGVMLPLTGVTWAFGIFSINDDLLVFQYLFCIFSSFQGLFVFLFHCVGNKAIYCFLPVMYDCKLIITGTELETNEIKIKVHKAMKIKRGKEETLDTFKQNPRTESTNDSREMISIGSSRTK